MCFEKVIIILSGDFNQNFPVNRTSLIHSYNLDMKPTELNLMGASLFVNH